MAGKMCMKCGKQTLWNKGNKLVCSNCDFTVNLPSNDGKGGKGQKCPSCGKFTWFNNRCNSCGANTK